MNKKTNYCLLLVLGLMTIWFQACNDDDDVYRTYSVSVQLSYPDGYESAENVTVTLTNTTNSTSYTDSTDTNGLATFEVPAGVYSTSVSERRNVAGIAYNFTGNENFTVTEDWLATNIISMDLSVSETAALIIKELYVGGCPKDDGSGTFYQGQYVILYNNSEDEVSLNNVCFGMCFPYNANATNYFYTEGGTLEYESEGWIPAAQGIWYFPDGVTIASGEQLVVALSSAVDNTVTYSQSINFANSDYYAAYDIEVFTATSYYPSPSSLIPTSHYLSGVKYGAGSAWSISLSSPAFFVFVTKDETPAEFANDANNQAGFNGSSTQIYTKVPQDWVIDAIDIYRQGYDDNQKRFTSNIDAGYVYFTNQLGYTLYRNVDKIATEALAENSGLLVYNYAGGTTDVDGGSTDASGIDAEASIAAGARIIYSDTNSSTTDFHQRAKASLRN